MRPKATPAAMHTAPMEMPAIWPLERGGVLGGASCVGVGVDVAVDVVVVREVEELAFVLLELLVGVAVVNVVSVKDNVELPLLLLVSVSVSVAAMVVSVAVGIGSGVADDVMGAKVRMPLCGPNLSVAVMVPPLGLATAVLSLQIWYALEKATSVSTKSAPSQIHTKVRIQVNAPPDSTALQKPTLRSPVRHCSAPSPIV